MKICLLQLLFVMIISSTYLSGQNLLNGPECVSFDSLNNRYLVSNWYDGNIIAIDLAGQQTYFKQRIGHALGNCISGNVLYFSTGTSVLGFNLDNPNDTIMYLSISGTTQLDGMTVDDEGYLYVVGSEARIYKINLQTKTYTTFVSSGVSARPQDVIYDRTHNRLLVCSWYANSPIQYVNMSDSTISNLVLTPMGNSDGLALDENGNYYFSSWTTNSIHFYDTTFTNPPALFSSGHSGPANLCFNKRDNIIAVPNFNSNRLDLIPVIPTSVSENNLITMDFKLDQNYPNPFNSQTNFNFSLSEQASVSLRIFNVIGKLVASPLVNKVYSIGSHSLQFDSEGLSSGIYYYSLELDNIRVSMKKMCLLK